ncbi:MAG: hypothetical protein ACRDGS_01650 [Chloroflexota bacterium]
MAQPAFKPVRARAGGRIECAILQTIAYFSLFDYTPSLFELHRYLHGESATIEQVRAGCHRLRMPSFAPVPGRPSQPSGRRLRFYLSLLKHLPFVRMIGLTGSRAVHPDGAGDTDLMIVAAPGRVWLCRLGAVAVARIARRFGDRLCPNYVISEDSLTLPAMSIYDAHELAQLVPLYGRAAYQDVWDRNPVVWDLLPNSYPFACPGDRLLAGAGQLKLALERILGGRLGDRLEGWERTRKIARLRALGAVSPEISLTTQQCKGHFEGHRARILSAYDHLLSRLGGG